MGPALAEGDIQQEVAAPPAGTSRWANMALVGFFLALIAAVPVTQTLAELRRGGPVQALSVFRHAPALAHFQRYERALEDNSVIAGAVRRGYQWWALVVLRAGNAKAVVGRDGSIFYRPSLDAAVRPGFMTQPYRPGHPVPAIVALRDTLRRQGVELVVLVVPGKEAIYPEWLDAAYLSEQGPPANRDMPVFLGEMERRGVTVVDPTDLLWRARRSRPLYLRQDTHWTPEGMALVADELVRRLPPLPPRRQRFRGVATPVLRRGDLYDMLQLPNLPTPFQPESVVICRVLDADSGQYVEPDMASPIILLGDSFTNIYSRPEMGWGDHAGLGEQLALRLGRSIDIIAQNDGGVNTARATLLRRPRCLAGKRLVIWQFAARDLVVCSGEWKRMEISSREE